MQELAYTTNNYYYDLDLNGAWESEETTCRSQLKNPGMFDRYPEEFEHSFYMQQPISFPWMDESFQYYPYMQQGSSITNETKMNQSYAELQEMYSHDESLEMSPVKRSSQNYESIPLCRKCRNSCEFLLHKNGNDETIFEECSEESLLGEKPVLPELALSPSLMSEPFESECKKEEEEKEEEKIIETRSEKKQTKLKELELRDEGVKKTIKKRTKSQWTKMSKELFDKMVEYEKKHGNIKQCEMERIFNVNRSTYWRWKKQYNLI